MVASKQHTTIFSPDSELRLTFASGPCAGRDSLVIGGKNITLGRGEECDVILDGETVSRRHCSIIQHGHAYFLFDTSFNGTFVNGQPTKQAQLHDSDQICVGPNLLIVNLPSADEEGAKATTPELAALLMWSRPRIVVKGLEEGVTQPFNDGRIIIGRDINNHLVLEADNISRRHAAVERHAGQYFVCDLNSANGTYLNGQRIDSAPLKDGDRVRIGNFSLVVSLREQDCILNFKTQA